METELQGFFHFQTYVQSVEEILVEHLQKNCRIFERDVFRLVDDNAFVHLKIG